MRPACMHANADLWEVDYSRLQIDWGGKIGVGTFSTVYKGKLAGRAPQIESGVYSIGNRTDMEVAVKMLPPHLAETGSNDVLLAEIELMKKIGCHPHLLSLVACVTLTKPVCLLTELCIHGSVLSMIEMHRQSLTREISSQEFKKIICDYVTPESGTLIFRDLLSFAWQVCNGMVSNGINLQK